MSGATAKFAIALILACVFLAIAPGLAVETTSGLPPLFHQDPDVQKCLSTIDSVKGCVQEVLTSFLSHQIQLIGPACCKALNEVDAKCWPKIFPLDPFFPPVVKNYCAIVVLGASPTPTP